MSHAELASSYAALILADDGIEITVSIAQACLAPSRLLCQGGRKLPLGGLVLALVAASFRRIIFADNWMFFCLFDVVRQAHDPNQGC